MQPAAHRQDRSLRSRLRTTVMVPTAALVALWLVVSGYLVYGAIVQYSVARGNEELMVPAARVLTDIMNERSATVAYLARRPGMHRRALDDARKKSDERVDRILDGAEGALPFSSEGVQQRIADLGSRFSGIDGIRDRVDSGDAGRAEAMEYYNSLSLAGAELLDEQARANPAKEVVGPALSAAYSFRVLDTLSRADARLSRSFSSGTLTFDDQQQFTRLAGSYRGTLDTIRGDLGPAQQEELRDLERSEHWQLLRNMERRIIEHQPDDGSAPSAPPISERDWRTSFTRVQDELTEISTDQAGYAGSVQTAVARRTILLALLGSVGVAGVAGAAIWVSRRSSQQLIDRLQLLGARARELADDRLPRIVERLGRNESVDAGAELPELNQSDDEIGQVARAFNAAQRTAIQAAVQQAQLRQGVNKVFVNLAHRSQTLAHRQLRLLDTLEHEQEDPDQLGELFALDHLATRSRRNAENLLILGGENPGRSRRQPTPLIDVVRGAISESGDYERAERGTIARVGIIGPAVADVIHLVAELVDNATTFSPPHTKVQLRAQRVLGGVSIEVTDRGLGMAERELEEANRLLADPPEFDAMRFTEKTRLGLFVVSRLARRHGIRVSLRRSPFGGVQAVVLLPPAIVSAKPLGGVTTTGPKGMAVPTPRSRHAAPAGTGPPADPSDTDPPPTAGGLPRRRPGGSRRIPAPTPLRDTLRPPPPADAPAGRPALPRRTPRTGPPPGGAPAEPATEQSALPRRTPKAGPRPGDAAPGPSPADDVETTPAESRSIRLRRSMSAFQQGSRRGRDDGRRSLDERPAGSNTSYETSPAEEPSPDDGTRKDR